MRSENTPHGIQHSAEVGGNAYCEYDLNHNDRTFCR